ncbi:glycosyltransferase [bacterium]|nr:MAG: glycosyltransferase [bacterium]
MKLSVVIPVLNSHEALRRQCLYWERLRKPDGVEIIIVDDGSDPPLDVPKWIWIHRTHDTRPWTWAIARNAGARIAAGKYLLMTDLDHIISQDAIDYAMSFDGQKVQFRREFAVLLEDGSLCQDIDVLREYGLLPRYRLHVKPLPNNFIMRRDLYWELGGYREDLAEKEYPQGEDRSWKSKWMTYVASGKGRVSTYRPLMYVFPTGQFCGDVDHNPHGLFHNLTRKTARNYFYRQQLASNGS